MRQFVCRMRHLKGTAWFAGARIAAIVKDADLLSDAHEMQVAWWRLLRNARMK